MRFESHNFHKHFEQEITLAESPGGNCDGAPGHGDFKGRGPQAQLGAQLGAGK